MQTGHSADRRILKRSATMYQPTRRDIQELHIQTEFLLTEFTISSIGYTKARESTTHSHTHTHTLTLAHSHLYTHNHTHTCTLTLTLAHSHTHAHAHTSFPSHLLQNYTAVHLTLLQNDLTRPTSVLSNRDYALLPYTITQLH